MGACGAPTGVEAAFLLSGLYDLAPLQSSFLQNEIAITNAEVERFSPLRLRHDPAVRVSLLVGETETAPFHEQAAAFASYLTTQGLAVTTSILADGNHMSVAADLGVPESNAGRALSSFIAGQRAARSRWLPRTCNGTHKCLRTPNENRRLPVGCSAISVSGRFSHSLRSAAKFASSGADHARTAAIRSEATPSARQGFPYPPCQIYVYCRIHHLRAARHPAIWPSSM